MGALLITILGILFVGAVIFRVMYAIAGTRPGHVPRRPRGGRDFDLSGPGIGFMAADASSDLLRHGATPSHGDHGHHHGPGCDHHHGHHQHGPDCGHHHHGSSAHGFDAGGSHGGHGGFDSGGGAGGGCDSGGGGGDGGGGGSN